MHTDWASLAELKQIAVKEAQKITFCWEQMETTSLREELLDSFWFAAAFVDGLEASYTTLLSGNYPAGMPAELKTPSGFFDYLLMVGEELMHTYILLDLAERYAAIESVMAPGRWTLDS